ncbi:MAG: CNNM domain-containing protein [Halobacteriales archaeon]
MVETALRLLGGVLLILANGFFVAIEFALTRARQYPAEEFDEPGLRRAWEMTDDLEIYLTSCQVGISATSIAVGIVAEPALASLFEPVFEGSFMASVGAGGVLAFVIINLAHLTHGEQTPTYLGVERTKFVCRYGATPLYWFAWLLSPVISLGDTVAKWTLGLFGVEMTGAWLETEVESIESRAELRNRLSEVLEAGDMPDDRRDEVVAALDIDETTVGEIAVPLDDVVALSTDVDDEENLRRVRDSHHTRYPLVSGDFDRFEGVVYAYELLDADDVRGVGLEDLSSTPLVLPADTSVSEAIDVFQSKNQEMALVVETADGVDFDATDLGGLEVVGLVTVTDALEEVVGEIRDPLDEQ